MVLGKYLTFVWLSVMAIISGFLIAEYSFFLEQTRYLQQLKHDYSVSVDALKKIMHDQEHSTSGRLESRTKKKVSAIVDETPQFLVVNREPAYLKKSALCFARRHKMEPALKKMYESDSFALKNSYGGQNTGRKGVKFYRKKRIVSSSSLIKREPLFMWPVERSECYLSSTFGPRKKPNGTWEFHKGLDLAAVRGTLVKAVGPGVVMKATYESGYGNTVVIAHNNKFRTRYAHLDKILVKNGQRVQQGDYIGKVGSTGCVRTSRKGGTPTHLHFEVYVFGKQVNPFYFLK